MKHLAVILALGGMTAFAGAQSAKTHKLSGFISDAKCGAAMHSKACTTKCLKEGQKAVFVDSKKKVWSIDNPDAVADYYGDDVRVEGAVDASNGSIHIDKVTKKSMIM